MRPWAIHFWEREWLINLILWFYYKRLQNEALAAFGDDRYGRTLQLSCAYGTLTPHLYERIAAAGASLDVIDAVRNQLRNLHRKLPDGNKARLLNMDATALQLPDATYDRVLMFFLPHELPPEARAKAFDEAFRVVKPGGMVLTVEFSKPKWWHPLRYLYLPLLKYLEPFASDIWNHDDITSWLAKKHADKMANRKKIFGNYYQIIRFKA